MHVAISYLKMCLHPATPHRLLKRLPTRDRPWYDVIFFNGHERSDDKGLEPPASDLLHYLADLPADIALKILDHTTKLIPRPSWLQELRFTVSMSHDCGMFSSVTCLHRKTKPHLLGLLDHRIMPESLLGLWDRLSSSLDGMMHKRRHFTYFMLESIRKNDTLATWFAQSGCIQKALSVYTADKLDGHDLPSAHFMLETIRKNETWAEQTAETMGDMHPLSLAMMLLNLPENALAQLQTVMKVEAEKGFSVGDETLRRILDGATFTRRYVRESGGGEPRDSKRARVV